jgi:2-C-methyl-D-erythritol 4-phosphate cytidylyltransferase
LVSGLGRNASRNTCISPKNCFGGNGFVNSLWKGLQKLPIPNNETNSMDLVIDAARVHQRTFMEPLELNNPNKLLIF